MGSGAPVATLEGHARGVACAMTPDLRRVVSASADGTLRAWDLGSGALVATLEGHTSWVRAYAAMLDGRHVISASEDRTLKVWDLESGACLFTHHVNAPYTAFVGTATGIVAGDAAGAGWFLDWPSPDRSRLIRSERSIRDVRPGCDPAPPCSPSPELEITPQNTPMRHTILFLAANPLGTDGLALDREARAIQVELERSGFRDSFVLETRWAAEPVDLLRELRRLKPTVVHFSGQGCSDATGARLAATVGYRENAAEGSTADVA